MLIAFRVCNNNLTIHNYLIYLSIYLYIYIYACFFILNFLMLQLYTLRSLRLTPRISGSGRPHSGSVSHSGATGVGTQKQPSPVMDVAPNAQPVRPRHRARLLQWFALKWGPEPPFTAACAPNHDT